MGGGHWGGGMGGGHWGGMSAGARFSACRTLASVLARYILAPVFKVCVP
jgi:hypothetical protein